MADIEDIIRALRAEIANAYKRGFAEGEASMRDKIMRAASGGTGDNVAAHTIRADPGRYVFSGNSTVTISRVPRGAVGEAIERVLSETPGLQITEIEDRALEINPDIARKSIGNDLRRLEGKKYRRDRPGGYRWFLIGDDDVGTETETAGTPERQDPADLQDDERR